MKKTFLILLVLFCVAAIGLASVSAASDDIASDDAIVSSIDDNAIEEAISEETENSISDEITDMDEDKSLEATPLQDGGSTIYVKTDGDDSNDGSSEENAVATIAKAYELAGDGSTINIGAGTYDQSSSITLDKSVTFTGADGAVINRAGTASAFMCSADNELRFTFNNLVFTAPNKQNNPILSIGGAGNLILNNCKLTNAVPGNGNGAIRLFYNAKATLDGCEFYGLTGTSSSAAPYLAISGNSIVEVKNSIFHDIAIAEGSFLRAIIYVNSATANGTVSNCKFYNNSGNMMGIIENKGGYLTLSDSSFENNSLSGSNVKGLVYISETTAKGNSVISRNTFQGNAANYSIWISAAPTTVEYNAFDLANGQKAIGNNKQAAVTVNYNYYGTNDNPSALLENVTASNWVIMDASASAGTVAVGDEITITADYSKYTDGTTTGDLTGTMANVPVTFSNDDTKGSISDIAYDSNKAIVTYTGMAEGLDSVAVTAASYSTTIPINVTAAAPAGNVIYVKPDGNDENDGSTEAAAVASIVRALAIASQAEGTDFTIMVAAGEYTSTTIESPEGKNINLIGADRDTTIIHIPDQTYGINVYQDNINWTVEGLTICDVSATATKSVAVAYTGDGGNFYMNNCRIKNIYTKRGAFTAQTAGGTATINNTIIEGIYGTAASASAMYFSGAGTINLDNIEIHGFALNESYVSDTTYARAIFYDDVKDDTINLMNSKITDNALALYSGIIESKSPFNVINTTIANNFINTSRNGNNGGERMFWTGTSSNSNSAFNFSQCTIVNNTIAKNTYGIFHIQYGNHNVEYSVIMDNKVANGIDAKFSTVSGGAISADYNYWGSNEKPNANVDNWVILTAETPEYAFVGIADEIKLYLNTYTLENGTTGALEKTMGEVNLGASYALCPSNPSAVTIKDGVGTIAYTATEAGTETLTLSSGDAFSFEVNADVSTLIYVDASAESSGTGTADSPFKTIAEALNIAADGKVVIIRSGTYKEKNLEIYSDITVKADKSATVIIDAEKGGRIFAVYSTATLKDLTLINGDVSSIGAGIYDMGDLTLSNVKIYNCTAEDGGAAVYVADDSSLTVVASEFIDNKADEGGALYVLGTANITNSKFITNDPENGGAIFVEGTANIESNEFTSNNANKGGAIYIDSEEAQTIKDNTFTGNTADKGEAIYIKNAPVTLSGNTMTSDEGIYLESGSVNAVLTFLSNNTIVVDFGDTVTLTATLTDDQGNAIRGGTVTFTANGETVGTVDLSGSSPLEVSYTVPETADGDIVISGSYTGGGIVAGGTIHPAIPYWFIGEAGYETLSQAIDAASAGDVIYYDKDADYSETINGKTINKDIVIKNNGTGIVTLDAEASKMFTVSADLELNNLNFINGQGFISQSSGTLNIINSTFKDSRYSNHGVVVSASGSSNINVIDSVFENLTSKKGPIDHEGTTGSVSIKNTVFNNINGTYDGFAIYCKSKLSIENSNFTNLISSQATATNYYGAICCEGSGDLTITGSYFKNIYGPKGAAIYYSASGRTDISKNIFDSVNSGVSASDSNIIYTSTVGNINYNVFLNVTKGIVSSSANIDYNYWGTNDYSSAGISGKTPNNWVIMTVSPDVIAAIEIDTTQAFVVDFKHCTDGTAVSEMTDTIPELTVSASALNGALDQSEIETVDNQAVFTYTANVAGEDTVTFTNANVAIPVTFNVSLDPVGVIYVAKNGTATGTGTEEDPVDTIARAIELANEAKGKIFIKEGVYTETGFEITKDLVITGLGNVVIDANNVSAKMFNIGSEVSSFVLKNIAITKANQGFGAVLYNNYGANVLFDNVSINESCANGYGNAAIIINKGNLTIENSNISNNGETSCLIYNDGGNVSINNTLFENNAFNTSGTTFGILFSRGNCTASIENSNFTNIASFRAAIHIVSGEEGQLSIANSKFENCSAQFGGSNFGYGGAVYSEVPLTVSDSTFINSKSYKDGAAIYAKEGATITNSVFKGGSSEDGDTAEIYSEGDLTISNSILLKTSAANKYLVKAVSGATVLANGNYWGTNNASSVISGFAVDNWVIMAVSPTEASALVGEAVEISIDFKHTNSTDGTIADFTGTLPEEITVYALSSNGAVSPAEITTEGFEAKLAFTPESDGENLASLYTGIAKDNVTVVVMATVPYSGPIYVSKQGSDDNEGSETAPVATIAKAIELAQGKSGQIIINEGTYVESDLNITADLNITTVGNVIWDANNKRAFVMSAGNVIISNITFTHGNKDATGTLLRVTGGSLTVDGSKFVNNGADIRSANGVLNIVNADLTLTNCVFENNTQTPTGTSYGIIYISGSTLYVDNCNFTNNRNKYGVFYITTSRVNNVYVPSIAVFNNSAFIGNNATSSSAGQGAAIYLGGYSGSATTAGAHTYVYAENCDFINNSANYGSSTYGAATSGKGGAIYVNNNATFVANNSRFINNSALEYADNPDGKVGGGAIYASSGEVLVTDCVFENNKAGNGSAIYMYYYGADNVSLNKLNIHNSVIIGEDSAKLIQSDYTNGSLIANSNWWGTNNPADKVSDGITVNNWVIMNVNPTEATITPDGSVEITVDFKHTNSTDGTIADLVGTLPKEFTVTGTASSGTLSPAEATISDSEAKFTFTPESAGVSTVTFACDAASVPVVITAKAPQKETALDAPTEITVNYGSGSLEVTLTAEGSPVEGKVISVSLNGEINLTGTTDAQGIAAIDLSMVPIGTYTAQIKFEEDDDYLGSSAETNIIVKEAPKTAEDLQKLIDETPEGGVLNLSNTEFADISGINITKDIAIVGDNVTIATAGDGNPVFNIASNLSNVSISGVNFVANNGDVLVKATATNGTDDLSIVNPAIELANNTVTKANDDVVASSITLFELESERAVLAPSNEISIKDNNLPEGAKAFGFEIAGLNNGSDINIPKGGNINTNGSSNKPVVKVATKIVAKNMKATTVNAKINGKKAGKTFSITLKDSKGNVLANKQVLISFNGKIYKRTTNAKGIASVKVALAKKGSYPVVISFLGDDKYNGSFAVAKVKVNPQKVKLTTKKKTYKAKSKKKYLIATLKATNKKAIKGKKLVFIINKKKYTKKTNKKGVAKVKVKLSKKKTYKFKVKFAGDSTFKKATKKGKVKVK